MLLTIVIGTTAKAQVPVITTQPNNAIVCKGSTATFSVAANNSPIGYGWEYSNNGGETFVQINSNNVNGFQFSNFNTANIGVLNGTNGFMVRGYAYNASGGSQPSSVAMLTINTATDSLYIVKPNTTPTCVGNSFLLAGSQANGVFSSSNSNVATVNCSGMVSVKAQVTSNINYVYTAINGCTDTAKYALNSNPPTPAIVSGASSLCVGANSTYTANVNNGVWTSLNNKLSIDSNTGIAKGANAGIANINYLITGVNGCTTKSSFATTVNGLPVVPTITYAPGTTNPQIGAPRGSFCVGKTFGVIGTPNIPAGTWSTTGAVSITSGGIVTINSVGAGSIKYTYTSAAGCSNSRTMVGNGYVCAARGLATNEQQETKNELSIFPNPAHSFIRLNIDNLVGNGSIFITDLYGKSLKTQPLSLGTNTINIAELAKGIYFANIIINNTKQVQKIIVE